MVFDEEAPGWVRKTIVGGVALIAVLIALVVVLIVGLSGDEDPPGGNRTGDGQPGESEASSRCGLPDGDQDIPTSAPDATWEQVGNLQMPSNPNYGPGEVRGQERTCFARSPTGAVFAAMNATDNPNEPNPGGLQYAGFRITEYTRDRVEMELAFRLTRGPQAGTVFAIPAPAVWEDGEWVTAPEGKDVEPVVLPSMDGYVAFGPGGQ